MVFYRTISKDRQREKVGHISYVYTQRIVILTNSTSFIEIPRDQSSLRTSMLANAGLAQSSALKHPSHERKPYLVTNTQRFQKPFSHHNGRF